MLRSLAIFSLITVGISRGQEAPPPEPDAVTIIDSGSTNRPGFRIVVDRSGNAELTSTPRRSRLPQEQSKPIRKMLPLAVVERFHADLDAAEPLASLPAVHCAKSASFGFAQLEMMFFPSSFTFTNPWFCTMKMNFPVAGALIEPVHLAV